MKYRPEILSLYEDIFKEAHETLLKEAGLLNALKGTGSRIGQAFRGFGRGITGKGKATEDALRASEAELTKVKDVAKAYEPAIRGLESDAALLQAKLDLASQNFAKQYGIKASPEALTEAGRSKKLWKNVGLGGLGATAVGVPGAYYAGQRSGDEDKKRTRNIAFGVGTASGLAAPHILRGLGQIAQGVGSTGLFPELQDMPNYSYPGGGY